MHSGLRKWLLQDEFFLSRFQQFEEIRQFGQMLAIDLDHPQS